MKGSIEKAGDRLQRKTLVETVFEKLKEAIWNCEYQPGEKITVNQISELYGVSSTCARETIKRLVHEGYLESAPYRETTVAKWELQDIVEMYDMRLVLEPMATMMAIPNLTEDQVQRLDELTGKISSLTKCKQYNELHKVNRKFHMTLYAACGNKFLLKFIESLWVKRALQTFVYIPGHAEKLLSDHLQLMTAIKDGDSQQSTAIMKQHMEHSRDGAIRYLQEFEETKNIIN